MGQLIRWPPFKKSYTPSVVICEICVICGLSLLGIWAKSTSHDEPGPPASNGPRRL